MSRKAIFAGNWKMHKTEAEALSFFQQFLNLAAPFKDNRELIFAVPFTCLAAASKAVAGWPVAIAAQNLHWEKQGAYTGEISASMLKATGASVVLIGHSERRQFFGDCGDWVNKKLRAALAEGLTPIVCLGESLQERQRELTGQVLTQQLAEALEGFQAGELETLVLAYEPVWAIGTGQSASPQMAQEAHAFIRTWLAEKLDKNLAQRLRLLYGGSVKPDNTAQLMAQPDIDGALVGGASLEPATFAAIYNYA